MVYLAFFIALIFVLPLVISVYIYYDNINKRLFIAIYLFKYIKLLTGYIIPREIGGFYFHISNKKAIIIDKDILEKLKGGPDFLPKIAVFNCYSIIDSGTKSDVWLSFLFFGYTILREFNCILSNNVKYLSLKSDLNVYLVEENLLSIKLRIVFSFNFLSILYKFFGSLIIRGINNVKKQSEKAK